MAGIVPAGRCRASAAPAAERQKTTENGRVYPFHLVNLWLPIMPFTNVNALPFAVEDEAMIPAPQPRLHSLARRACVGGLLASALAGLAACSGTSELLNSYSTTPPPQQQAGSAIGS